ncbi:luc7-like protein 3 [Dermacentor albipictus]|uniref:luc7-like protein 3 n=1 Tax=Dermacentor albipictus TaxID=60249 RepID=UPI0038FCED44
MQQIVTKYNPLAVGAKRIGNTTTIIVVFNGIKVPKYVRYGSTLYPCSLYRKQIEVCKVCGKVGHRRDVCPTPNVRVCLSCGVSNPREGHKCVPECKLCGEEHPTGDRLCRAKYKVPYVVRRRRWERRNTEEQRKQALESSAFPRLGRSRSRSASRGGSRSASRHASRYASRHASRSASRGRDSSDRNSCGAKRSRSRDKVSWADVAKGEVKGSSASSNSATSGRSTPSTWQAWTTSPYYKELEQLRATNATLVETTRRLAEELAEVKKELQAQQAHQRTEPAKSPETPTPATDTPSHQGIQSMDTTQDEP